MQTVRHLKSPQSQADLGAYGCVGWGLVIINVKLSLSYTVYVDQYHQVVVHLHYHHHHQYLHQYLYFVLQ